MIQTRQIIARGVGGAVALLVFVVALISSGSASEANKPVDEGVTRLVDANPDAPSVNLTPNDPGYMETSPAPAEPAPTEATTTTDNTTAPTTTAPGTTITQPTATPEASPMPTPAPTTTAPATPPSPQANPNIIPLVIAWDGLKCPQPDSYYVQTRDGAMLLCPLSIQP